MNRFIDDYKNAMQLIIDKNLQGLDTLEGGLSPTQRQERAMKFSLEFDEKSYRISHSLLLRLAEVERKKLVADLTKVGAEMKQAARLIIQTS